MIKTVHCKKSPYTIYIGRPKAGQEWGFGNPFEIGSDGPRDEVIDKYEKWLNAGETFLNKDATPARRQWILDNLYLLKGETLGCWCSPLRCHSEVLINLLDNEIKNE